MASMCKRVFVKKRGVLLVAVVLSAASLSRAAYVITTQGTKVEGTDIRAKSNGEIVLTTPKGTRTFYKGQYTKAVADRPQDFDKARKLAEAGKYDEAIKLLKDIITHYRFLEWDNQARIALPQVYSAKGDHAGAVSAYEDVLRALPRGAEDTDVLWAYREALLKAGEYDKLERLLNDVIKEGSREQAARAQIMRGDIKKAQDQIEAAALDYLRTVVLYESQSAQQPEATFKAAEALEELRDRRAKDLYKSVVEKYPNSPYAAEARKKL